MKIPSVMPVSDVSPSATVSGIAAAEGASAKSKVSSPPAPAAPLESAVLNAALAAIRDLPEVDQAKVAVLRDALSRGDMPFDASKLAALIERYHRTGQ